MRTGFSLPYGPVKRRGVQVSSELVHYGAFRNIISVRMQESTGTNTQSENTTENSSNTRHVIETEKIWLLPVTVGPIKERSKGGAADSTWSTTLTALCSRLEPAVLQLAARVVQANQEILLDQLGAIVDGRPVKQSHVLFVRLSDIIACFHQLLAAFQDSEPDRSHTDNKDYHAEGSQCRSEQKGLVGWRGEERFCSFSTFFVRLFHARLLEG